MAGFVYDVRNVSSFRELLEGSVSEYPDNTAFLWREGEGVAEVSYAKAYSDVKLLAEHFISLGLEGEKVAVYGRNCYGWALTYLAVTCGVGVIVPIDRELKTPDVSNILRESGAKALVYTSDKEETAAESARAAGVETMISTDTFPELLAAASPNGSYERHRLDPRALGVLIYTSGTTGMAKGVMLSQYNICTDIAAVLKRLEVTPADRVLSVLPLHHTYESAAGFLGVLYAGGSIAYCSGIRRLSADFQLFKPTVFVAVPLLLESLHAGILKRVKSQPGGRLMLAAGAGASKLSKKLGLRVFSPVRGAFGGSLRLVICGAAALDPAVTRDYERFGIRIVCGYGLTETAPVLIMHNDFYRSPDDIGSPISGVKVKLVGEGGVEQTGVGAIGEITVKGPNVMLGYYKNPEETARVLRDGWFSTGDIGERIAPDRYRITGRVKSMIVTKNGKKIFPEELEYLLGKNPYVKESLVSGVEDETDTVVTAKLFPDFDAVNAKLAAEGIGPDSPAYTEAVCKLLQTAVKELNRGLPQYKMIRRVRVRMTEFPKTTTHKLRRTADSESDYVN